MKSLLFPLVLFLVLLGFPVLGSITCDCNYGGPFMKVARGVEAVVLVKVVRYKSLKKQDNQTTPLAMEANVIKIYKGKVVKSTIIIWGDDGMDCRPYVNTFALGKEYIIALNSTTEGLTESNNNFPTYYVSICGEYWLSVNEKTQLVYGDIDSSIRLSSVTTLQRFEVEFKNKVL